MDDTAAIFARLQQRRAAIALVSTRTPNEAARVLLRNPRISDPDALIFLGRVLTRGGPMPPKDRERLIHLAARHVPAERAA